MPVSPDIATAISTGNLDLLRGLLPSGSDLNKATLESGQSLLLIALYQGQRPVAEYLLSLGPSLSIFEAAAFGKVFEIQQNLAANPSLLDAYATDGWTPLHLAAFFGQPEATRTLVEAGASLSLVARNPMANTPLHAAIAGGSREIAEQLLRAGANPSAIAAGGYTPVFLAASRGDRQLVERLLALGVSASQKASDGQTPAEIASQRGHSEVALLLSQ